MIQITVVREKQMGKRESTMAFVEAKCPACGGEIQLDDAKESGFCMYCGTKVLMSEAIPQKVTVEGIQTLEQKLKNAETFAKLGETDKAISLLTQITEEFTSDYRAWWLLAIIKANAYRFFTNNALTGTVDLIGGTKEYQYAYQLASDKDKIKLETEYGRYTNQVQKNLSNFAEQEHTRKLSEQENHERERLANEEILKRKAETEEKENKKAKHTVLMIGLGMLILVAAYFALVK